MRRAPQQERSFFVTAVTRNRSHIFQMDRNCELFLDLLRQHRLAKRFTLHSFVLMPDHLHAILTPGEDVSLEKAMQFIKGRFSFELKRQFGTTSEVWQKSFNEERLWSRFDYDTRRSYIERNPVRARLVQKAEQYRWSSVRLFEEVDRIPEWLI